MAQQIHSLTTADVLYAKNKKLIRLALVVFILAAIAAFLVGRTVKDKNPMEPGFVIAAKAQALATGYFQATLDVKDRNRWTSYNFKRGEEVLDEKLADIRIKRYNIQAPYGAAELPTTLELAASSAFVNGDIGWVHDSLMQQEVQNPLLSRWYHYSYWTHLLVSHKKTYAVRLHDQAIVALRFRSYYCQPEGSGCLTIQYKFLVL